MSDSLYTPAERASSRRYMIEMAIAAVTYVALLVLLPSDIENRTLAVVVALLPLLPVLWMAWCVVGFVRRTDERQRLAIFVSFSIAFGVAMLVAVALALVAGAGVVVPGALWWVFVAGMTAWPIALFVQQARSVR